MSSQPWFDDFLILRLRNTSAMLIKAFPQMTTIGYRTVAHTSEDTQDNFKVLAPNEETTSRFHECPYSLISPFCTWEVRILGVGPEHTNHTQDETEQISRGWSTGNLEMRLAVPLLCIKRTRYIIAHIFLHDPSRQAAKDSTRQLAKDPISRPDTVSSPTQLWLG